MRAIRPISELGSRVQEAGKIRLGIKNGNTPKAIDTFRFTSPHLDVIEQLAAHYGGTPRPWDDPKASVRGQHEVITDAKTIRVLVPPGGLTQHYELWSGAGCARRCNGLLCEVPGRGTDGPQSVPCICTEEQDMQCRPQTRLSLVLPDVTFRGVWTLSSKSWNAAEELVGMERMIDQLQQDVAIVQAEMHLEQRSRMTNQGKRNFVVPTLTIPHTAEALAAGDVGVSIGGPRAAIAGARAALTAGPDSGITNPDPDEDVAEGVIVPTAEDIAEQAVDLANELILDPHKMLVGVCQGVARKVRGKDTDVSAITAPEHLDEDELIEAGQFLADVRSDRIEITSVADDGRLNIKRHG